MPTSSRPEGPTLEQGEVVLPVGRASDLVVYEDLWVTASGLVELHDDVRATLWLSGGPWPGFPVRPRAGAGVSVRFGQTVPDTGHIQVLGLWRKGCLVDASWTAGLGPLISVGPDKHLPARSSLSDEERAQWLAEFQAHAESNLIGLGSHSPTGAQLGTVRAMTPGLAAWLKSLTLVRTRLCIGVVPASIAPRVTLDSSEVFSPALGGWSELPVVRV